jgi:putative ATP-dependent endonuclease of OLD family
MMMIEAFPDAYDVDALLELNLPDAEVATAVLGKRHDGFADQYKPGQQQLFDAYHHRFKIGSKPARHVEALAALDDAALAAGMPAVLGRLIDKVAAKLEALPE